MGKTGQGPESQRKSGDSGTRDKIVTEAAELQREIRQAATDLRKEKSRDAIDRTRKTLASVQEKIRAVEWQPKPGTDKENEVAPEPDNTIMPGDTVYLKRPIWKPPFSKWTLLTVKSKCTPDRPASKWDWRVWKK